ncbi:DMT family transporter [Rhizobium sp. KVB221]|uniref:DMT family transporter n=1 Tax=Rhizobium setariae TaxID=2801340 RepID=A0A936YQE2_9HYPH|nr:DMT family transporter [Rhizobium setariae]MBL0372596.1 DMT family transporter [Rhizobium setariae]
MQNRATLGIIYLCLGILIFSLQDAIIKAVSGDYPLTQVVSIRCLVSAPILLVLVHFEAGLPALAARQFGSLMARSSLMLAAYTTYYMAFPALPLADAVALYFTVPLFTMALAVPLLGETIGWRRITAVLIGFVGVIIMLRPGAGLFEPAALLSLFSAFNYALAMLMARKMGTATTASVMAFYQNAIYLLGALTIAGFFHLTGIHQADHKSIEFLIRPWVWPDTTDLLLIGSCGVIAAIGMTLLTQAYRIAKASVVTSFEYTGMLWAPLWGFMFFGEIPYLTTIAGAGLIIAAGLFALSSPAAHENRKQ